MTVSESQRAGILILAVVCLAVYGLSLCVVDKPRTEKNIPFAVQSPETVAVEFRGGQHEGIYFFPCGTIFQTPFENAETDVPLPLRNGVSADLYQGARLSISREGELHQEAMSAATRLALDLPLDVNQADADALALVPGIGGNMAAAIVRVRGERGGFSRLEELCAVPGIKEKTIVKMRPYLSVGSER